MVTVKRLAQIAHRQTNYFIFRFFRLLPLKNKVFFSCFTGKRYDDSPRYISERLHEICPDVQIVWQEHKDCTIDMPAYIKKVKFRSLKSMYEMATSKVWVDSHLKKTWMKKRREQYFIETWHGGIPFKKICDDVDDKNKVSAELVWTKYTSEIADLFISDNDIRSELYRRAFYYKGEILKCGLPRLDPFFKDNAQLKEKIRALYNIPGDCLIAAYMPTFRDNPTKEIFDLDFEGARRAVKRRFGKECVFIVRLHPLMLKQAKEYYTYSDTLIDTTDYPHVQDLLLASDLLITDYSSTIMDFLLTKRPSFLFAVDEASYTKERGFYKPLNEYPFPLAHSNAELIKNIEEFNKEEYLKRITEFEAECGTYNNGTATDTIVEIIRERLKQ